MGHDKSLSCSIYDVLTQSSNDFQWSLCHIPCRQTLAVAARHDNCRVRCRHGEILTVSQLYTTKLDILGMNPSKVCQFLISQDGAEHGSLRGGVRSCFYVFVSVTQFVDQEEGGGNRRTFTRL